MMLARIVIVAGLILICSSSWAEESSPAVQQHTQDYVFSDGHYYPLHTLKDPNQWTTEFNKAAARHGLYGTISDCKLLVDIPTGGKDGNHSYGAYCELQQDDHRQTITICNDIMIDRIQYGIGVDITDKKTLAAFVLSNCYGH